MAYNLRQWIIKDFNHPNHKAIMSGNDSRRDAINQISSRPAVETKPALLQDLWATNVFDLPKMKQVMPKTVYKSLEKTIRTGSPLEHDIADLVANAMKDWAIAKGANYYAHVFYPLTGATAEKHDGFISPQSDGSVLAEFSGKLLIQGEPDASSFPNGGIRSTFEARGYTAWDVTSPAYIMETPNGSTLCIPTVFVSWTGEALDKKTPLLRSNAAVNKSAQRVLKLLGHTNIAPVSSSCGPEQEYFLVDSAFATQRPDLLLAGRSLFGKPAAKGQQFEDHYFGAIPERVQVYMQEVEQTLYKLGIPAKTRHNEVAPAQFEIAPVYEAANIATDHQQLTMTILKTVAKKHGFLCLLHEKPFKGVNGSGKHANWSIGNSTQGNLLDPGDTPHANAQFLLFCGAAIRGVHQYGPLLRAVVATAANDHRLGANEAPPAIISVYLGTPLSDVFEHIKKGSRKDSHTKTVMNIGVDTLPPLPKDPGDRNRTSPFAFTGNRFEFRAVGSGQSIAGPLVAMNTIMADSLDWVADQLESVLKNEKDLNKAIELVLKKIMEEHGSVIFNGNGYSEEWHKEAEFKRGLRNLRTSADALPVLKEPAIISLFQRHGVLSPVELASRFEIYSEQYIKSIDVEAKLTIEIAKTKILPAAMRHLAEVVDSLEVLSDAGFNFDNSDVKLVANLVIDLKSAIAELQSTANKHDFNSVEEHMQFCARSVRLAMENVRAAADALESEVADDLWPLPTYAEMLFMR